MKFSVLILVLALTVFFSMAASATIQRPPTLKEVVQAAEQISMVDVQEARAYAIELAGDPVACGYIYRATVLSSIKGSEAASVEFYSTNHQLTVGKRYLVYLASTSMPRKLLSTNSRSERQRAQRLEREARCVERQGLMKTIYKPSEFLNRRHFADIFKTERWIENPFAFERDLPGVILKPEAFSIGTEVISREQMIDEYMEGQWQMLQPIKDSVFVFRALNWRDYCDALTNLMSETTSPVSPEQARAFCQSSEAE